MEATEDPTGASEPDHRFHAEIAAASGNPALASLLAVFRARSRTYQVFTLPQGPELRRKSDADHRVLATAIADRDPGAAAGAAEAHVARTERWLRALLPPVEEGPWATGRTTPPPDSRMHRGYAVVDRRHCATVARLHRSSKCLIQVATATSAAGVPSRDQTLSSVR